MSFWVEFLADCTLCGLLVPSTDKISTFSSSFSFDKKLVIGSRHHPTILLLGTTFHPSLSLKLCKVAQFPQNYWAFAYHLIQIKVNEWKTALKGPLGHYRHFMPPGFTGCLPTVFFPDMSLWVTYWLFAKMNLRLQENQLFLKALKSEFHISMVSFLFVVSFRFTHQSQLVAK